MRYLPHTDQDIKEMLAVAGMESLDDLFKPIPEKFRLKEALNLPQAMDEWTLNDHMEALAGSMGAASKARVFIGAGSYCHHIPSALPYLLSRSEFSTAYTPYQPEISQGTLQGIYEFQSMISQLLGMEIATASHYDCGTALAEALLIAIRKNKQTKTVAVSSLVHPFHREIIKTYLTPSGYQVVELAYKPDGTTDFSLLDDMDVAGIAVQSPNFFGCIEDLARVKTLADSKNALFITSFTEALAYGLLKNPGSFGADLVAGEGQSLGIAQSFGGPGLGILTSTKKLMRSLPGRYVGKTTDIDGQPGFVLTLATREQHIKREKASSNICSNNGLNAMAAGMYMAFSGKIGMRKIAQLNHNKAVFLKSLLKDAGLEPAFDRPFFNEFVVKVGKGFKEKRELLKTSHNMVAGLDLETWYPELANHYLFCATEVFSRQEMEILTREVK